MATPPRVSLETLNAFIDNELDAVASARVHQAVQRDAATAARLRRLRQVHQLSRLAYADPPAPKGRRHPSPVLGRQRVASIVLAIACLVAGVALGSWFEDDNAGSPAPARLHNLADVDMEGLHANRLLLHINTRQPSRVEAALATVEQLLQREDNGHQPIQLEVVTSANGLAVLRKNSRYAQRIHRIAQRHGNVQFLACGITTQNAHLRERRPIDLLQDARLVDAALEQILRRLQQGWLYIRA